RLSTNEPLAKLMLAILIQLGEMETEILSERQRLKFDHMRKTQGWKMHGQPRGIFATKVVAKKEDVFMWKAQNKSNAWIAKKVGLGIKTVRKMLRLKPEEIMDRKAYSLLHPGWSKDQHTLVLPEGMTFEEWDAQQRPLREKRRKLAKVKASTGLE